VTKIAIVGHDQQPGRPIGAIHQPNVVDQGQDHGVSGPRSAISDGRPSGDSLAAQASLRRPVEDQLDADLSRYDRS
jgi:hypothetical protein